MAYTPGKHNPYTGWFEPATSLCCGASLVYYRPDNVPDHGAAKGKL